ncbi:MAG: tetratricopeptide repeat protein [Nitrospirae bacterium]|nr:tetratricopeptide repeat protein [Nitrospirota bacterium]
MNRAERRRQERLIAKARNPVLPLSVNDKFGEAVSYHKAGRFLEAEQLYRQILEEVPSHADALHLLGVLAYQKTDYLQARDFLEQAIRQDEYKPLYHYNLALALEKNGDRVEAIRAYEHAVRLKPNYIEAQNNLGNVYREQGDLRAAISAYERVIQLKPDYASAYNNLGVALKESHDLDRAVEVYQHALRLDPNNAESHYNLGMVYIEREQGANAAPAFQKALELKPDYAKAHHNLGLALLWQGHSEEALFRFRKSADLTQNHGRSVNASSVLSSRIKHDAEQLEYLRRQGISVLMPDAYSEVLRNLKEETASLHEANQPIAVSPFHAEALAPSFNRILHYASSPIFPDGALNPNLDREDIQQRYQSSYPEIICIDELLKEDALKSLRQFCLESTIWKKGYMEGYVGAFLSEGFASSLLLQVAEELRQQFPGIFHDHPLLQAWAFKQDSQRRPLNIHADAAAVNVNFWITPNEANLDLTCGGLTVWDKEAPKDWDFKVYNDSKNKPKIMEFLRSNGAAPVTVPYRENRALIFNSDLFHESDRCHFRDDYESRRINITLLYGHRSR